MTGFDDELIHRGPSGYLVGYSVEGHAEDVGVELPKKLKGNVSGRKAHEDHEDQFVYIIRRGGPYGVYVLAGGEMMACGGGDEIAGIAGVGRSVVGGEFSFGGIDGQGGGEGDDGHEQQQGPWRPHDGCQSLDGGSLAVDEWDVCVAAIGLLCRYCASCIYSEAKGSLGIDDSISDPATIPYAASHGLRRPRREA